MVMITCMGSQVHIQPRHSALLNPLVELWSGGCNLVLTCFVCADLICASVAAAVAAAAAARVMRWLCLRTVAASW
jgi:hypothetical protein